MTFSYLTENARFVCFIAPFALLFIATQDEIYLCSRWNITLICTVYASGL